MYDCPIKAGSTFSVVLIELVSARIYCIMMFFIVRRLQRCARQIVLCSTLAIFGLKYRFVGRECGSLILFNEQLFIHS